ncbi:MAG: endolytic transglycosylase MltG [Acidobacteriaceae bacterium]|nr:endolytic transglycosylase MltG [Acidobacteriaceae bacterium]
MRLLTILFLLAALVTGGVCYRLYVPYGTYNEAFVDIPVGTRTPEIAQALEEGGVIRSRRGFEILRLIKGGKLKAGEYRFDHPDTLLHIYARLVKGDVFTVALSVPDGYNLYDIAQAAQTAGLGTREGFLAAARSQTGLIADFSPKAESLEGYLFPDTYHFSRHATDEQMVAAMVHRFRQTAAQIGLTTDVQEAVTMASLVEKETGVATERPVIAGVFENRMRRNMPLETDPSVIYAALLEDRYRGTIYASDLASLSLYNTYKHLGLPPGPVCNPGRDSLLAALHPATTKYLYFVSDAAGHSVFAEDLKQQSENVQQYRHSIESQVAH